MIVDLILFILKGVLNIILLPISFVNIAIDFVATIPIVENFLQVVYYILPWSNIIPIIIVIFALFVFRIGVSLAKTFITFIPFF